MLTLTDLANIRDAIAEAIADREGDRNHPQPQLNAAIIRDYKHALAHVVREIKMLKGVDS